MILSAGWSEGPAKHRPWPRWPPYVWGLPCNGPAGRAHSQAAWRRWQGPERSAWNQGLPAGPSRWPKQSPGRGVGAGAGTVFSLQIPTHRSPFGGASWWPGPKVHGELSGVGMWTLSKWLSSDPRFLGQLRVKVKVQRWLEQGFSFTTTGPGPRDRGTVTASWPREEPSPPKTPSGAPLNNMATVAPLSTKGHAAWHMCLGHP